MIRVYGQAPSHGRDEEPPLTGRSGERIRRLLGDQEAVFDNVLDAYPGPSKGKGDAFPVSLARARGQEKRREWVRGDKVILLGVLTADAFGFPGKVMRRYHVDGVDVRVVPHPSGVNLFWNDAGAEDRVRAFLCAA